MMDEKVERLFLESARMQAKGHAAYWSGLRDSGLPPVPAALLTVVFVVESDLRPILQSVGAAFSAALLRAQPPGEQKEG